MPEPITIDALEALGFGVYRERTEDGGIYEFAIRKAGDDFWLAFYEGSFHLDNISGDGQEFPNDMKHVRRAMKLFGLRRPRKL
jgi:hypothetical protein